MPAKIKMADIADISAAIKAVSAVEIKSRTDEKIQRGILLPRQSKQNHTDLALKGSTSTFIGPEPYIGILRSSIRESIER